MRKCVPAESPSSVSPKADVNDAVAYIPELFSKIFVVSGCLQVINGKMGPRQVPDVRGRFKVAALSYAKPASSGPGYCNSKQGKCCSDW